MRKAPRNTVVVFGSDEIAAAVRAVAAAPGYAVRAYADLALLRELTADVAVDAFVMVIEAPRSEILPILDADEFVRWRRDNYFEIIIVSDDEFDPPSVVDTPEGRPFPPWAWTMGKPVSLLDLRSHIDDMFEMEDTATDYPMTAQNEAERAKPIDLEAIVKESLERRQRRAELHAKLAGPDGASIFMTALRLGVEFDEVDTVVDLERARRAMDMSRRGEHPVSQLGDEMSTDIFVFTREGLLRRLTRYAEYGWYEQPTDAELASWSDDFLRAYLTRAERSHGVTADGEPPDPDERNNRSN